MAEYTVVIPQKPLKKTVTKIGLHLFSFNQSFRNIRTKNKDKKCHLCNAPFEEGESLSLAFVKGEVNHLICESCASFLIEQGVPYVDRKTE